MSSSLELTLGKKQFTGTAARCFDGIREENHAEKVGTTPQRWYDNAARLAPVAISSYLSFCDQAADRVRQVSSVNGATLPRLMLDADRVQNRATFLAQVAIGLRGALIDSGKIRSDEVDFPVRAFFATARAYFLLSDLYKIHASIQNTDDIKKAAISMAAIVTISPFQARDQNTENHYIPFINLLYAELVACAIMDAGAFYNRNFESKLHFFRALETLDDFECLKKNWGTIVNSTGDVEIEATLVASDRAKLTTAFNFAYMMSNFKL